MRYQPKRSTARWLEGAPRAVLACYDSGPNRGADRYTVIFGAPIWDESYGRNVPYLALSETPAHPCGVCLSGDMPAHNRNACGRKVRWRDLPEPVRISVMLWLLDDSDLAVCRADKLKEGDAIDLAGDWYADPKGNRREFECELAQVCEIERETESCIRVGIEGVDNFGFPPDHLVYRRPVK